MKGPVSAHVDLNAARRCNRVNFQKEVTLAIEWMRKKEEKNQFFDTDFSPIPSPSFCIKRKL